MELRKNINYPASTSGFSLIELMVVISIISALASLSFPYYLAFKIRASRVEMNQNFRMIGTLYETYLAENQLYPPTGWYGQTLINGTIVSSYCNASNPTSMTATIGFVAGECDKIRYFYQGVPYATHNHPRSTGFATATAEFYTVRATSQSYTGGGFPSSYQAGVAPFSPKLCKASGFGSYTSYYMDSWIYTENQELIPWQSNNADALNRCI